MKNKKSSKNEKIQTILSLFDEVISSEILDTLTMRAFLDEMSERVKFQQKILEHTEAIEQLRRGGQETTAINTSPKKVGKKENNAVKALSFKSEKVELPDGWDTGDEWEDEESQSSTDLSKEEMIMDEVPAKKSKKICRGQLSLF